jgi:hypothetical protein
MRHTGGQPVGRGAVQRHVSLDRPDEVREGENWRLELVNLAGATKVGRITVLLAVVGARQAVVGDEPGVAIDRQGASVWAREQKG